MAWSTKNWISIAKTTSVHLIFIKEKKKSLFDNSSVPKE